MSNAVFIFMLKLIKIPEYCIHYLDVHISQQFLGLPSERMSFPIFIHSLPLICVRLMVMISPNDALDFD